MPETKPSYRQSIYSVTGTEKGVKPGANPVLSQSIGYDLFNVFLRYKYTGRLVFGLTDEMFVYKWLFAVGLADGVEETEDDRKEAYNRFLARAARGFVNEFTVYHVRKKGTQSPEIDFTAFEVARKKEIIKAFDRMIAEEMQVDNYLRFVYGSSI